MGAMKLDWCQHCGKRIRFSQKTWEEDKEGGIQYSDPPGNDWGWRHTYAKVSSRKSWVCMTNDQDWPVEKVASPPTDALVVLVKELEL